MKNKFAGYNKFMSVQLLHLYVHPFSDFICENTEKITTVMTLVKQKYCFTFVLCFNLTANLYRIKSDYRLYFFSST